MNWDHRSAVWVCGLLLFYSVIFNNEHLVLLAALVAMAACYFMIPGE